MARKSKADAGKKAPSVQSFLSRISTPKGPREGAPSPAKGLLGDITKADLEAVGRLASDGLDSADADAGRAPTTSVAVEVAAGPSGRRQDRTPFRHVVDVRGVFQGVVGGDDPDGAPRTKDLSHGGVFVETAHLLEVGDPVVLSFPLPDGKRVVVNGRVRWVTPFGRIEDPTPGMGIEFVGVDAARLARLRRVLEGSTAVVDGAAG